MLVKDGDRKHTTMIGKGLCNRRLHSYMCKKEAINKKVIFEYKKTLREWGIQVMEELTQRRLAWIHTFLTSCICSALVLLLLLLYNCQDKADVVPCPGWCETVTMLANVRSKRCGRSRLYRRNKRVGSQRVAMYNTFGLEQQPLDVTKSHARSKHMTLLSTQLFVQGVNPPRCFCTQVYVRGNLKLPQYPHSDELRSSMLW